MSYTRTRWNNFLFLITDDRDFRPQTCTNDLVFKECKHIKNIFEDVYFTKNRTKTLKSVIMNDARTGPHLGKSKENQEISEFKILVGTNVSHVQTV
jgi:hypothetical protein